jgi:phosphate ABC transporter phosphate-binding protein
MRSTPNVEGLTVKVRTGLASAARGRLQRRARIAAATVCGTVFVACAALLAIAPPATAVPVTAAAPAAGELPATAYTTISGAGSTWAANAINNWVADVAQNGLTVNYTGNGSTTGRAEFRAGTANFGASEIPYAVADMNGVTDQQPTRGYAYMPDVAGGTTFMYNLKIGAQRVTNLRLSGKTIADIFTGRIQYWDNTEIKTDNPDLALPHIQIIPVVRSDGSGATADFTEWMLTTDPSAWHFYCTQISVPASHCIQTSTYTLDKNDPAMVGQSGDTGVSGYVAQNGSNGAIGYVEYSYAIQAGFPVAKVLNAAGYYTEPTPGHVAVSLLKAQINMDKSNPNYLTENLSSVYSDPDPRTYELSAYSYLILPTDTSFNLTQAKGRSLGAFGSYALCQGQQQVDNLGYSALPINLVEAAYAQLQKIPGAQIQATSSSFIQKCNNPTFDVNGNNKLAEDDPQPASCDKEGSVQCTTATGGAPGSGGATGKTGGTSPSGGGNGTNPSGGGNGTNPSGGGNGTNPSGGGNGTNPSNGSNGTGTNGPGGSSTNGAGTGAVDSTPSCDQNTGVCSTAGGGTGNSDGSSNGGTEAQAGNPVPITLSSSTGDGVQVMLMALCGFLFLGLCVIPPLAAQASGRRRQQRLAKWSGTSDDEGFGGQR